MPATPCRAIGCPNLATSRLMRGYCDDHAHLRTTHGWQARQRGKTTTQRGYGYAWQKLRQSIFERDGYLCQVCRRAGRITPATEIDHITNKAVGGTDDPDNLQAICKACHKAKTQEETYGDRYVFMPEWLESIPNATLVFGCAGSGKTTWANTHQNGRMIVDLDQIIASVSGKPLYIKTHKDFAKGVRQRNDLLLSLAKDNKPCIILLTGETERMRQWWIDKLQPKEVVVMRVSKEECVRRIEADSNRPTEVKAEQILSVYQWQDSE